MEQPKRKRGRKPKKPSPDTMDYQLSNPNPPDIEIPAEPEPQTYRRGHRRTRKHAGEPDTEIAASPERRSSRFADHNNGDLPAVTEVLPEDWERVEKVMPSMDAVVKVFCVHTEPNFSLPWQRKRQYSSSSSGFVIGGRRVLTNAHSVEHYTQVKLKKRGSDTKYLATVLAIGTECDIGKSFIYLSIHFLLALHRTCIFSFLFFLWQRIYIFITSVRLGCVRIKMYLCWFECEFGYNINEPARRRIIANVILMLQLKSYVNNMQLELTVILLSLYISTFYWLCFKFICHWGLRWIEIEMYFCSIVCVCEIVYKINETLILQEGS